MRKFKVGDIVRHNYSKQYTGEIHEIRKHHSGYNYFVRFIEGDNPVPVAKDWYKAEVLELIEAK